MARINLVVNTQTKEEVGAPLSDAEETARDAEEAAWAAGATARAAAEEINRLEAEVTPRRLREAYADPTWITAQEALIAVERAKL
jgi:hypothetical protein